MSWRRAFDDAWDRAARERPPDYWSFLGVVERLLAGPDAAAVLARVAEEIARLRAWYTSAPAPERDPARALDLGRYKLLVGLITRLPPELRRIVEGEPPA